METDTFYKYLTFGILFGYILWELATGNFFQPKLSRARDWVAEIISTINIGAIATPFIAWSIGTAGAAYFPAYANILSDMPIWGMVLMFIIFDDMVHYWYHRACHTFPALYNLHRSHHSASYMSVRLSYRNSIFFYFIMPSLWTAALLIYLGLGAVYPWFIAFKMLIISGAHCNLKWDRFLYKYKWLHPIAWVVERTISTPATHMAHHGKHMDDGITNYKGNYGNLLFFWDVLFGTAKITRKYPKEFGLEDVPDISLSQELFWPLAGTKNGLTSNIPTQKPAEKSE